MSKYTWEEMQAHLDQITNLPTLPSVMINAINIAFDPKSKIDDLYQLLRHDPAITAQILRVVNSSYVGASKTIESLKTAMVLLGMDEVVSIVSAITMADSFRNLETASGFEMRQFWLHCVTVGETAQSIVNRLKLPIEGEVFTAGLLHDIGSILLASSFAEDYHETFSIARKRKERIQEVEKEIFGVDHGRIGGYLGRRWNLPERLLLAIEYHHDPGKLDPLPPTVALTALANYVCGLEGIGLEGWELPPVLKEDADWRAVCSTLKIEVDLDLAGIRAHVREDIDKAKELVQLMMF